MRSNIRILTSCPLQLNTRLMGYSKLKISPTCTKIRLWSIYYLLIFLISTYIGANVYLELILSSFNDPVNGEHNTRPRWVMLDISSVVVILLIWV